ncbi:MAG: hypothetical protein ACFE8P_13975, partial [Promethearchaeota archaeon]
FQSDPPKKEILSYFPYSVTGFNLGNKQIILTPGKYFMGANWACPKKYIEQFVKLLMQNRWARRIFLSLIPFRIIILLNPFNFVILH